MKLVKNVLTVGAIIVAILSVNTIVSAKTVIVDTDTLKLRKEASKDSDTIQLLNNGQKLEYIDEDGDWYKVKLKDTIGYVHKDYSKIEEENQEEKTEETETKVEETNNEEAKIEETEKSVESVEMKVSKDAKLYILPLINANIIEDVKKDTNVKIISKTNGWAYIETEENNGWIRIDVLVDSTVVSDDIDVTEEEKPEEVVTETSKDTEITTKIMYVNTSSIYIRKGPSTDTEVVDSLILNSTVKVTAENGDWYKVEVDGITGYIAKRLLSSTKTETEAETTSRGNNKRQDQEVQDINTVASYSSKGEEVVGLAKKYLGCSYVYGASGPSTFDCSGFTMFIYKQFGVSLSHSATAQSKVGTYVSKDNLRPGDLVFFTDYETGEGIGHCGIYVGNGEFIHASSGTGYCVKISTLLTGSYYNRYETARRVL